MGIDDWFVDPIEGENAATERRIKILERAKVLGTRLGGADIYFEDIRLTEVDLGERALVSRNEEVGLRTPVGRSLRLRVKAVGSVVREVLYSSIS